MCKVYGAPHGLQLLAGEEGYDKARTAEIDATSRELHCETLTATSCC